MATEQNGVPQVPPQLEEFSFIDKGALDNLLTCNICGRYLNVAPVIFSENMGSICGRCNVGTILHGLGATQRQHSYELLIKNFTFPCTNKVYGCTDVLKFENVVLHERGCSYQCMSCPFSYKHLFSEKSCSWTGNSKLLLDHFKLHQEEFLDPPQFEWPQKGTNKLFFTTLGNQVITVAIKHERDGRFACLLMVNGTDLESQCFRYQLELSDEDKNNSILLRKNRLEPLSNFLDSLSRPESTLEVDIEKISEMLQNTPKVIAKFGIVKKHKKEIMQITGSGDVLTANGTGTLTIGKNKNIPHDEEMLAELECPVCNEFMVPPIYICPTGHSVCNECKSKVSNCPTCRAVFGSGRNYTLEKLTLRVKYPCRNREIGCGFVSTSDKIKQHQSVCDLTENPCILKCGWKGLTPALYNHFLDSHRNQLLDQNTLIQQLTQNKNITHYFLYVMGELFCLSLKNCGKFTVKFKLQQVGYLEDQPKYKYVMQFVSHPDKTCPSFNLTNFCHNWNENLDEVLGSESVTLPGDFLKPFIYKGNSFYFKVTITKV